jgi:hypothetical protein
MIELSEDPTLHKTSVSMSHYELHQDEAAAISPTSNGLNRRRKGKDTVVIVKSYYVSHSLRYASLLGSPKPEGLQQLSASTWYDIQAQLEPLIRRHLFLPKSYLFVPVLCLLAAVGWFFCFSIASVNHRQQSSQQTQQEQSDDDIYSSNSTTTIFFFSVSSGWLLRAGSRNAIALSTKNCEKSVSNSHAPRHKPKATGSSTTKRDIIHSTTRDFISLPLGCYGLYLFPFLERSVSHNNRNHKT